jgi:hypothetical protein
MLGLLDDQQILIVGSDASATPQILMESFQKHERRKPLLASDLLSCLVLL